jgi:hypothetical protein
MLMYCLVSVQIMPVWQHVVIARSAFGESQKQSGFYADPLLTKASSAYMETFYTGCCECDKSACKFSA